MMTSIASAVDWLPLIESANDLRVDEDSTTLTIQTTGNDPYLLGQLSSPLAPSDRVLQFEYFSTTGIKDFSIFCIPPLTESNRLRLPSLGIAESWQTYTAVLPIKDDEPRLLEAKRLRMDFGRRRNRQLQIRNVIVRPKTVDEIESERLALQRRQEKQERAARLKQYLSPKNLIARQIESVRVTHDRVAIGMAGSITATDIELYEYRPFHSVADAEATQPQTPTVFTTESTDSRTLLIVPRRNGSYDRAASAWRIKSTGNGPIGPRRYPDSIVAIDDDFAKQRHKPKSQKGLGGFSRRGPVSDLTDLGVHAITINISLNQFLKTDAGPQRQRIPVAGDPIYFDPTPFRRYDQDIDTARKHDLVVSAILLIASAKDRSRPTTFNELAHPANDGGTYAMPNLASARGVAIYSYVLDQLARRYRTNERPPGQITNWIAHNEVDFHNVWTNMGRQPAEVVTETYYRSMRLIDSIARQHNPHARVFASLTHHWTTEDPKNWQSLSPRAMLESLQQYSRLEGDFDWGIAYHPYPQSLFARIAWKDTRVTNDFDSPLITLQNIEVLGRFLKQPTMLKADGQMRGVILSEQGFHSLSDSAEDQAAQAASLWWAMQRVRQMPWIESFHYHRWIDHPREGGLNLGLRMQPTNEHPFGQPKQSWHVYRAIGTEQESTVTQGLASPETDPR